MRLYPIIVVLLLFCSCYMSQHVFLQHEIYELSREGYDVYYNGQKIWYGVFKLDEQNIRKIVVDDREMKISIIARNKHTDFIKAKDILDTIESNTGTRRCLMVYDSVPYVNEMVDSFRIEKSCYKGFITLDRSELLPDSAKTFGKLIFYIHR